MVVRLEGTCDMTRVSLKPGGSILGMADILLCTVVEFKKELSLTSIPLARVMGSTEAADIALVDATTRGEVTMDPE